MAKSRAQRLTDRLMSELRQSGNSPDEVAKHLGIDPVLVDAMLNQVENDRVAIKGRENLDWLEERLENRQRWFTGEGEMEKLREKTGETEHNWIMRDYKIEPGKSLDPEVHDKASGFQIIIRGREEGKVKYMTSHVAGDISSAMSDIVGIMKRYSGFEGEDFELRTFEPYEE